MLLHVCSDGFAIDLFEYGLERGGVHQIFFCQLLNGDPLGQVLRQIVVDAADDLLRGGLQINGGLRSGYLHDLLDNHMQQADLRGVRGCVIDLLTAAPADEQTALYQRTQMVRDGWAGHFQKRC